MIVKYSPLQFSAVWLTANGFTGSSRPPGKTSISKAILKWWSRSLAKCYDWSSYITYTSHHIITQWICYLAKFLTGKIVTSWKKHCNHNYLNRHQEQCALLGVTPIRTQSVKLVFYSFPLVISNCEKAMLRYRIYKYWLTLQNLLSDNCTVQFILKGQYG